MRHDKRNTIEKHTKIVEKLLIICFSIRIKGEKNEAIPLINGSRLIHIESILRDCHRRYRRRFRDTLRFQMNLRSFCEPLLRSFFF